MAKLELSINPGYVRNWDIWEAVRELIQNAADAHDLGHTMEIRYQPDRKEPVLQIINRGITIKRDTLLLGTTSKADDSRTRGCFGEGMKLSWLVLLRKGLKIWCKSGDEKWTPSIEYSSNYESELLTVETSKGVYENCTKVEVRGLPPEEWEAIKANILFPPGNKPAANEMIDLGTDRILLAERYKGHLFVKGIWVCYMHGEHWFGYDIDDLTLDRDRKLANHYDLQNAIRYALNNACTQDKISTEEFYSVFSGPWEEAKIMAESFGIWQIEFLAGRIATEFHRLHGPEAVPVKTTTDSIDAHHHGITGIVVPDAIRKLVELLEGKYEDRKTTHALEVVNRYSLQDLTTEETDNLTWTLRILYQGVDTDVDLTIADFRGDNVLGCYNQGEIFLARRILSDRTQLIATAVHEVAHSAGLDGTVEHRNKAEAIFGRIIDRMTK